MNYYHDYFRCQGCREFYSIRIPVAWADSHPMSFVVLTEKMEQARQDHFLCQLVQEVKQFLRTPVIIQIGG